jgi:hypothetical protein
LACWALDMEKRWIGGPRVQGALKAVFILEIQVSSRSIKEI